MSSHSPPTYSSLAAPSPLPEPPSSSSSSSTSSSNKILSVGAIQTIAPEMEEVRDDDVGNVSDRRALIAQGVWDRVRVSYGPCPYCRSVLARWTTVYTRKGNLPNPPSSSCIAAFFLTCTCCFLSTRLRWVSFRHSTWRRVSCT